MNGRKKRNEITAGDCLAYKIENDENYRGRYIILYFIESIKLENQYSCTNIRLKITNEDKLPASKEELDKLSFVMNGVECYERRFYPLSGTDLEKTAQLLKERCQKQVFPDENGFLYVYLTALYKPSARFINKCEYIGNFELSLPEKEFIPYDENYDSLVDKYFEEDVIQRYEDFNLKKSSFWNRNVEERIEYNMQMLYTIISLELQEIIFPNASKKASKEPKGYYYHETKIDNDIDEE